MAKNGNFMAKNGKFLGEKWTKNGKNCPLKTNLNKLISIMMENDLNIEQNTN